MSRSRRADNIAYYESELACPPLPMALFYLWRTFNRLRRRKGSNGFSANPIEWPDIDAFERKTRFYLAPWEVEVIEMLDDLYLAQQSRQHGGNTATDKD